MKRQSVFSALAAWVFISAGDAEAQNRDLRPLSPPAVSVTFAPDDFSSSDMAYVGLGRYQTYYYAGFEMGLRALRDKANGSVLYTLNIRAPRVRAPGRIISVAARGGMVLRELTSTTGPVNCSRSSCRHDVIGDYEIPESILASARAGSQTDIRVGTSCGPDCDVVLPITPASVALLDKWLAERVATTPGGNQVDPAT